ncbi:MAG: DegT/DnrJ/EryC1/StrS family aminotransferase [Planctomycetaceae bacterium]|nr:DegT/DnrJ/EryC1/StrS family aminotransferase [Planctomycetaceae bacterium]
MESIPLSKPDVTEAEIQAVTTVLRSDRLSIGPAVEAFEQAIAARANRRYAIAVNSGTSGLHLCVRSLEIGEGDEVITTPFSFISTTNCILFERGKPVLVDIDPDTYNMDPAAAEAAITPATKAILPVEAFGNTAHFDAYEAIARRHGLGMIEDSCEALGGSLNGRPAGNFGDCGVFAFYPNKQITTGEGGVIVTDHPDIRDMCCSLRNQGRDTEHWLRHARLGYNYRLSDINAAMGAVQVQRLDDILARRRRAADLYAQALAGIEGIHLPPVAANPGASWFVYVVRLDDSFPAHARDQVLERLKKAGIACSNYFVPIHTQPYIREMLGTRDGQFPITERVAARTIALPFFAALTQSQVDRVAAALKSAIAGGA